VGQAIRSLWEEDAMKLYQIPQNYIALNLMQFIVIMLVLVMRFATVQLH
jgi:hypothetical protein